MGSGPGDIVKYIDPFGAEAGKYSGGDSGGKFGGSQSKPISVLSSQQETLLGPLASFFSGEVGRVPEGVDRIDKALTGNSAFVKNTSSHILNDALLRPALRSFEQYAKPAINESFARIGGTLSSRRNDAVARTLGDIYTNATGQVAALTPQLIAQEIAGIGQMETLRFLPSQQAFNFASTPTRSLGNVTTPDRAGYAYQAAGTAAGALLPLLLSDERTKKDIEPIEDALVKVRKMKGVRFEYKHVPGKRLGVIAQNLKSVTPELVVESDGFNLVRTHGIEGVFIEAIKELDREVGRLRRAVKKKR